MIAFNGADVARVQAGEITVSWRLWKYPHVKPGRTYRFGSGGLAIDEVREVAAGKVTDADAHEVGLADAGSLLELVRSHTGAILSPETVVYRVAFHYVEEAPERPQMSLSALTERLRRMDRERPWTLETLQAIAANPGLAAIDLAAELRRAVPDLKADIRKLTGLGLTERAPVGYEVSALGQRYLDALEEQ